MKNNFSPILLFTYNRLWHTQKTVESLLQNEISEKSSLFIFSDGAKNENDNEKVNDVRNFIKKIKGFNQIEIIEREKNYGLAENIINGVSTVIKNSKKVIVLEDDLSVAPYFLKFMNDALNFYEDEEKVGSIHGYVYPVEGILPGTFFIRGADCWGWATWERAWKLFERDGKVLSEKLKSNKLINEFNFEGSYNYYKMLQNQIKGKNNSWAVRWHASLFLNNKLTLYPGKTLVNNIGADDSGTHVKKTEVYDNKLFDKPIEIKNIELKESIEAKKLFIHYFNKIKPNLLSLLKSKLY